MVELGVHNYDWQSREKDIEMLKLITKEEMIAEFKKRLIDQAARLDIMLVASHHIVENETVRTEND